MILERGEREEALKRLHSICDSLRKLRYKMKSQPCLENLTLAVSIVAYDIMLQEGDIINKTLVSNKARY